MPTYTAIALDRLLEPDAPKSKTSTMVASKPPRLERRNSNPIRLDSGVSSTSTRVDRGINSTSRGVSVPPRLENGTSLPISKTDRKNGKSAAPVERNDHWTQISPALYATPKSTPLPDSPSSFPPSPYVINHKRRGPRLLKSHSEDDVATSQRGLDEQKVNGHENNSETMVTTADDGSIPRVSASAECLTPAPTPGGVKEKNGSVDSVQEVHVNGSLNPDYQVSRTVNLANEGIVDGHYDKDPQADELIHDKDPQADELIHDSADQISTGKTVSFSFQVEEADEFLDPQDSMSVKSNTEIDAVGGSEQFTNFATPSAEFYDAWEELSSEHGPQQQLVPDIEAELRDIRLSLLMEIEKRKQAEEAFHSMCSQCQTFRNQLSSVGLTLPADPLALTENEHVEDSAKELCQQVHQQLHLVRFVSNSIGRGIAKAEAEMEMEAQLELKNFDIARLSDRLRYYEAVNREMSQRNQEAIDNARRLRQRRKRKQKWVWGSVAAAITIGSAVLAWSYISTGKEIPSSQSHASEGDHASKS